MTKEARKALRAAIIDQLDDDMMPLEIAGHTITDQLVYAGCSQWSQEGREWDTSRSAFAWIVDGQYQLTFPSLDYFDGHNQIEKQTSCYLQPNRSENPPDGPEGEPLQRVPDSILLELARGIGEAIKAHEAKQAAQDQEAIRLAAGEPDEDTISLTITVPRTKENCEAMAESLIKLECDLRAQTAGIKPGNTTADDLAELRRKFQEENGLRMTLEQVDAIARENKTE